MYECFFQIKYPYTCSRRDVMFLANNALIPVSPTYRRIFPIPNSTPFRFLRFRPCYLLVSDIVQIKYPGPSIANLSIRPRVSLVPLLPSARAPSHVITFDQSRYAVRRNCGVHCRRPSVPVCTKITPAQFPNRFIGSIEDSHPL